MLQMLPQKNYPASPSNSRVLTAAKKGYWRRQVMMHISALITDELIGPGKSVACREGKKAFRRWNVGVVMT